jgi:hypothetical protein
MTKLLEEDGKNSCEVKKKWRSPYLMLLRDLVDLVGIEPTTSPARPGRAQLCFMEAFINS